MKINPFQPPKSDLAALPSSEASTGRADTPARWIASILFWTVCAGIAGVVVSAVIFKLSISDLFGRDNLRDLYLDLAYDLRYDWFNPGHRRQAALQLPLLFVSVGFWGTISIRTLTAMKRWITK